MCLIGFMILSNCFMIFSLCGLSCKDEGGAPFVIKGLRNPIRVKGCRAYHDRIDRSNYYFLCTPMVATCTTQAPQKEPAVQLTEGQRPHPKSESRKRSPKLCRTVSQSLNPVKMRAGARKSPKTCPQALPPRSKPFLPEVEAWA